MRTWIGGGCLTAVTAAALAFVLGQKSHPSHVGPCLSGTCNVPLAVAPPRPTAPGSRVTDVVPAAALLRADPAEPGRLPFVRFDEPPLAAVVQASATDGPARIPPAAD